MNENLKNQLDLSKQIVVDIVKKKGIQNQKAMVKVVLDISGSMGDLFNSGKIQTALQRLVPLAMQFDDDQAFELYLFGLRAHKAADMTLNNIEGFVQKEVSSKFRLEGGTNYEPVLSLVVEDYIGPVKSGGFFGIGGSKKEKGIQLPAYVIFITDGNNEDRVQTEQIMRDASKHGIFFQFVGIGSARFSFLEKLDNLDGRFIDNANFFAINDLTKVSDDELYNKLLGEFPQWLAEAKSKNLIQQ